MAKRIAIIDVETNQKKEVFDIGLVIGDNDGNILHSQEWILQRELLGKPWYPRKVALYFDKIANPDYPCELVNAPNALEDIDNLLTHYDIREVYAYNAGFDATQMMNIAEKYNIRNPIDGKQIECLWAWACQTIFQQKTFKKFAKMHDFRTDKGNYKTNAEVAYAYITKNPDFVEEHTGLEDAYIEYRIYLHCLRQKKYRLRGIIRNPWILAQENERIRQLPKQFQTLEVAELEQFTRSRELIQKLGKEIAIKVAR